ncbi:MAG: hypothetical protein ACD_3C00105G0003 [uncultured bacterium (gcode 4)]|uniref:Uncharacterized protein n=1 Tax=uncultured bacterium (gcode 4) TaxID=1234023 RepID=K2GXF2_9BACT|nr:MAG: hypothetical protein ACD_3C00105G0003 [uncultured bacterium (gcode 4)]
MLLSTEPKTKIRRCKMFKRMVEGFQMLLGLRKIEYETNMSEPISEDAIVSNKVYTEAGRRKAMKLVLTLGGGYGYGSVERDFPEKFSITFKNSKREITVEGSEEFCKNVFNSVALGQKVIISFYEKRHHTVSVTKRDRSIRAERLIGYDFISAAPAVWSDIEVWYSTKKNKPFFGRAYSVTMSHFLNEPA